MDKGHELTNKQLAQLERKLAKEYTQANKELQKKFDAYMKDFDKQDKAKLKALSDGRITQKEYDSWRYGQMLHSKRAETMIKKYAEEMNKANRKASDIMNGAMPDIYAENFNFGTYQLERDANIDTDFTLYNERTVEKLAKEDKDLLPRSRVNDSKDTLWNKAKMRSALTQGILQGDSNYDIAKRLMLVTGMNLSAAIRNARTMTTGAQNAGRLDSYDRASKMGLNIQKTWVATLDDRTRDSHVALDGETVPLDEPFSNGLMYPADPDGKPAEVYNCRCTMISQIEGFERDVKDTTLRDTSHFKNESYDDWKNRHKANEKEINLDATGEKTARNYDNHIAKAIGRERYDEIVDALDASKDSDIKTLFQKHIDDVKVINHQSNGQAYCSIQSICWNAEKGRTDTINRKAFSTFYHESGHALDNMLAREKGGFFFYSTSWNNGEFSQTIKDEVGAWVNGIKNELKAGLKTHATDIEWLKEKGLLGTYSLQHLEFLATKHGCTVEDILGKKVKIPDAKYFMPKVVNQNAYNIIEKEIKTIQQTEHGNWKISDISDILEGATKGNLQCGWGHGKSYWKTTDVAVEAFAEMSQAHIVGGESLEILEKYLPKSVDAFRRMCSDAVR